MTDKNTATEDLETTATSIKSKPASGKKGKGDKNADLCDRADQLLLSVAGLKLSHRDLEDRLSRVKECNSEPLRVNDDKQRK